MIIRIHKKVANFVMVNRSAIEDSRLSWRAKGLLVYFLSKPDHWHVRSEDVIKHGTDGRDAVRSGMAELAKFGYAELINTSNGREWHIKEDPTEPCPENPSLEPCPEKPHMGLANMADSAPSNNKGKESKNKESNNKAIAYFSIPSELKEEDGFITEWEGFVEMRKKTLKKPLTKRAAELILAKLKERPRDAVEAIAMATEKAWRGFEWEWFDKPAFTTSQGQGRFQKPQPRIGPHGFEC